MKTLLLISVLLIGAKALSKEQYNELMKKVKIVGTQCMEKEHATASDLAKLIAYEFPPPSHEAKCILACFYEHYKMMKADGTFDKQAAIDAFVEVKNLDADLYGKILKIIDTCEAKKQIVEDRCETASLMATCVKGEADSMGVTKESFLVSE